MPEPLWKIRKRKGMSVNQLAAKSGVPAISIREYESGRAIRSADLPKLAKTLYVEEWDIELQSDPLPKSRSRPAPKPKKAKPRPPKKKKPPVPVRPTQIQHLLTMTTRHFGKDRAALEKEVKKPLEALTQKEASELLKHYQELLNEAQGTASPEEAKAKRKRAYLPEGVDQFELKYLTAKQEAGILLHFTLFDGTQKSGRIVGFCPYSITIQDQETGDETTIQKLAIAYYRSAALEPPAGGES